jgi:pyruvate/2-oxoglutarate/acetoin dehydrogenase E1 component
MYNDGVTVPLVIRAPMGGRRGYGPTHSQSVEKHFMGVPGLWLVAPHVLSAPGDLLRQAALDCDEPVVFIESKTCYPRAILEAPAGTTCESIADAASPFPTIHMKHVGAAKADAVLWCYGGMVPHAIDAVQHLRDVEGLHVDLVAISQLSPVPASHIRQIVDAVSPAVSVYLEEANVPFGWGSEVLAQVDASIGSDGRSIRHERIGAVDTPIPSSRELERAMLPQVSDIVTRIVECF